MRLSRHMFDDVHKDAAVVPESPSTDYEMSRPPFEEKDFELEDVDANQEEKKGCDPSRERRTERVTLEDSSLQIGFKIEQLILLGSPLGIFVSVYNEENFITQQKLQTVRGFYNVFHPQDLIAYRIEPLFELYEQQKLN